MLTVELDADSGSVLLAIRDDEPQRQILLNVDGKALAVIGTAVTAAAESAQSGTDLTYRFRVEGDLTIKDPLNA
jgi:hypothetical protein